MKNSEAITVLLVEDNLADAELTRDLLAEIDPDWFELTHVDRLQDAEQHLLQHPYDVILLDFSLPDALGLEVLARMQSVAPRTPIVMLTGVDDESVALEAVQSGAQDYLVKGQHDAHLLRRAIRYAIERKQADNRLRDSEERYRDLFDNASDLIQSVGNDGHFIYVNRAWTEIMGYTEEQVRELKFEDIIHPDHVNHYRQVFDELGRGAAYANIETVFVTKDGREHFVEGSLNAYLRDDKFIATRGMFRDVTERKHTEQALAENEQRYRQIVEEASDVVFTTDLQGKSTYVNPPARQMTGYAHDELIGQHFSMLVSPQWLDRVAAFYQKQLEGGVRETRLEFPIVTADGTQKWVEQTSSLLTTDESVTGFQSIVRDITERKEAQEELRYYVDELTHSNAKLETLRQITLSMTTSLDLDIVFEAILDGIRNVSPEVRDAHIFSYERGRLIFGAAVGPQGRMPAPNAQPRPDGITNTVARQSSPIIVPDMTIHPLYKDIAGKSASTGSIASFPLKVGEHVVGVMNVAFAQPREYSEQELDVLKLLANQAALAIQNARLYDETNRRRRYLETLRSISLQATPILDRHELMQAVVDGLVRAFKYQMAVIMLGDDGARELNTGALAAQSGMPMDAEYRQSYDLGLLGWVMRHNKPYMTNDAENDSEYYAGPGFVSFKSMLAVPVRQHGKAIGVLSVESTDADAFSKLDMEAMTELATELGLNLENLALNEQAQQAAALEERQRLARDLHDGVSQSLSSALAVAGILPIVLERDPDQIPDRVEVLTDSLKEAAGEMRALLIELQPAALVNADMGDLLKQLTVSVSRRVGVPTNLEVEGKRRLPPDVKIALYRITQEALNNAAKHAEASQMRVNLRNMPEEVELRVTDDGRGFDPSRRPSGHFGLGNMHQRAENIGATLNIASKLGEGTEVTLVWEAAASKNTH